ncbi:hypothetical protein [Burkholderia latens]|uniref:hypothetical protein n=1 Tax=Burkholderia latens TaxID=488446 RepID=UPI00158BB733|nr:hypothetical protein [Burkholderia latens]
MSILIKTATGFRVDQFGVGCAHRREEAGMCDALDRVVSMTPITLAAKPYPIEAGGGYFPSIDTIFDIGFI